MPDTLTPEIKPFKDIDFDSFFSEKTVIILSTSQVAWGIWLFKYKEDNNCYVLSGLYRDGFLNLCVSLGYYKRYTPCNSDYYIIKDIDGIISETTTARIKDDILSSDILLFEDMSFEFVDSTLKTQFISVSGELLRETYFRNYHNVLNKDFLEHLSIHSKPLLKDDQVHTFLCFSNTIIDVTGDGFAEIAYSQLGDRCIWESEIIQREFIYRETNSGSHFGKFINNVADHDEHRMESISSTIGYLVNGYCDPANARAVLFYDMEVTDLKNPQGGTGKGLLANALKQVRNTVKLDGKQFDASNKFKFQRVTETTRIVWLDDIPSNTGFEIFHSNITDGWNIERKNQHEIFIKPEESPKLLIASNSVIQGEGNTNERRQHIVEFAPYYSRLQREGISEPVRHIHGCTFFDPNEWDSVEWQMFYSFIVDCCWKYHSGGLIAVKPVNVGRNKLMQGTSIEFVEWIEDRGLEPDKEYCAQDEFLAFKETYSLDDMKQRRFTGFLRLYAVSLVLEYKSRPSNGKSFFTLKSVNK